MRSIREEKGVDLSGEKGRESREQSSKTRNVINLEKVRKADNGRKRDKSGASVFRCQKKRG